MKCARRRFLHMTAGAGALSLLPSIARPQVYPARPVRLLVGFPPGGGSDVGARILANRLSEVWGQQVVVENKPGAGGHLAIEVAARQCGWLHDDLGRRRNSALRFDDQVDQLRSRSRSSACDASRQLS